MLTPSMFPLDRPAVHVPTGQNSNIRISNARFRFSYARVANEERTVCFRLTSPVPDILLETFTHMNFLVKPYASHSKNSNDDESEQRTS